MKDKSIIIIVGVFILLVGAVLYRKVLMPTSNVDVITRPAVPAPQVPNQATSPNAVPQPTKAESIQQKQPAQAQEVSQGGGAAEICSSKILTLSKDVEILKSKQEVFRDYIDTRRRNYEKMIEMRDKTLTERTNRRNVIVGKLLARISELEAQLNRVEKVAKNCGK